MKSSPAPNRTFPSSKTGHSSASCFGTTCSPPSASGGGDVAVAEVMRREFPTVQDSEMLESVFEEMQKNGLATIPVMRAGRLVGLVTLENVGEWVMIQSALKRRMSHDGFSAGDGGRNIPIEG